MSERIFCQLLESMVLKILKHASERSPLYVPGFYEALDACTQIPLPHTTPWFEKELKKITNPKPSLTGENRSWGDLEKVRIIQAATVQIPGSDPKHLPLWQHLLADPSYSTQAYIALESDPCKRLMHLGKWWETDPPNKKNSLRCFVAELFLKNGSSTPATYNSLRHFGAEWPQELRMLVNREMARIDHMPAFRPDPASG